MRNPNLESRDLSPSETAGMLLAVREYMVAHGEPFASVDEILATTGASAADAHAIKDALLEEAQEDAAWQASLPEELPPPSSVLDELDEVRRAKLRGLTIEVMRFAKQYPGCVSRTGNRERYADCFRQFVLELRRRHADVTMVEFAVATDLPLGTLKDWLRGGRRGVGPTAHEQLRRASRRVRARRV